MDYQFQSLQELFQRVRPALRAKKIEFHRLGYSKIKEMDIWNFLLEEKWKSGKNLMLYDIVSDIMNLECKRLVSKESQTIVEDNEII